MKSLAAWLVIAVTAVSLLAPEPVQAASSYFSLTTSRTFLPGEKITVHLYTNNVQALEFRLYRINDPVAFFEKLDDVHGFGRMARTSPKEQIDKPTLLERFHDWKQGLKRNVREFFRSQFSTRSRAEIREARGTAARKAHLESATMFAQVPVLNSKQLVARWRQEVPQQYFTESQDVPVEKLDKGVYVVEATDGTLRAYTLLVVSEMGLVTKTAPGQVLAYTVDRRSGSPVSGAQVEVFATREVQSTTKTDEQGLSMISLPQQNFEDTRIIATHGKDVGLVSPYLYGGSSAGEIWMGYLYTDRPVYRPGHTVHFKGILRTRKGENYLVPSGKTVQFTVTDSNQKQVYSGSSVASQFGGIHGDFTLAQDAALGYYSINVSTTEGNAYGMNGGFTVDEYKKPEYEVRVTPDKQRILQGESFTATIEAKYYFGEPVAGADVTYVVHRSGYWSPFFEYGDYDMEDTDSGYDGDGDYEGGGYGPGRDYAGEQLSEQTGKLDANGRLQITIPTSLDKNKYDARYRVEARVTDAARREIAGYNSVIATYGSFQINAQTQQYMYQQGETIKLNITAKDYDGNPVLTAFHADMIRPKWYSRTASDIVLRSADGQTGKDGVGTLEFPAQEDGSTFKVTAKTPEGREIESSTWVWVVAPGHTVWRSNRSPVQIIADKKSYKPGDTAKLLIMTHVPPTHMLVTSEGRTIKSHQVIKTTGSSTVVSVPITSQDEPNFFVSVAFMRDNTLYSGSKSLKVPADEQKLSITVEPSRPQFKPGEAAKYVLTARDAAGKPVAGEFSLGVVDEAIYAIQPDSTMDIHQYFYGNVYNQVGTSSSLAFYFTGQAGTKPMILAKGKGNRLRLAQMKPSDTPAQPKVRKLFPDTALWLAEVRTDQNGRAEAQFAFPDSLTTWRATVRGVTMDTKAGSTINRVIVRKNLMVRLAAPRFFRQGDDVTLSTIVHNYLTSDKAATMSLDAKGLDLQEKTPSQVNVASKGEQRVDWHAHAQNVRESVMTAKALTNEESDAMELTLPVIPFGVKLPDAKAGAITAASGQDQVTINLPGDPATAAPTLKVSVSPSIAGSIFGALDFLTAYPYGCTEQTMSSFLPNIVVSKAMQDLKLESTINTPALAQKITAGLDRLYDFQHDDGGWGWWKEDESHVFMTAYVVSGLSQAKNAGYAIKPGTLERAENWLKQMLKQHERMRPDLRAYVVYALALDKTAESGMLEDAYGERKDMSAQGRTMLGLALQAAGDPRAKEIASDLEKEAIIDDFQAHWASNYDYLMEFYADDSVESTAYAVRLLSLTKPESPLLPKAAFWLVNHRDGGYYWMSTKQTSMVVFGLLEYMKISRELDADFTASVYVNDKLALTRRFTRADSMKSELPQINLSSDQLRSGANTVRVQKSGSGRLYWSARGEYYSAEKRYFQDNKLSLSITRDYYRLAPVQLQDKIVYDLQPLQGDVHSGDVIAVRISVAGSEWRYLLVEDPIPAGAEFVQRDDLYQLRTKLDWWGYWYTRREFHDDRASFFQTYFNGRRDYIYLLKIVNPGKFRISPAFAQPMYQPSVISTTDAAVLEVKP